VVRFLFTFVMPIAVMTTFPAQALLGTISTRATVGAFVAAIGFAILARMVWLRSIGRYTSAGG
jgi:ABC-2 type transport system permease protein